MLRNYNYCRHNYTSPIMLDTHMYIDVTPAILAVYPDST